MLGDGADISACVVQVIKESQRLFPAAAIGPIRYAAENTELGGYFIPKGTRVQVRTVRQASPRSGKKAAFGAGQSCLMRLGTQACVSKPGFHYCASDRSP